MPWFSGTLYHPYLSQHTDCHCSEEKDKGSLNVNYIHEEITLLTYNYSKCSTAAATIVFLLE